MPPEVPLLYRIVLAILGFFMPIPSCFHYCSSIIELDVRDGNACGSSFTVQDGFGYPGLLFLLLLFFHVKLIIVLSKSVKSCVRILMGIVLNL